MADDGKRLNGEGLTQVWESMQSYVQESVQGGGTVKSITAGEGLTGGTITEAGTIALKPASENEIGGVKVSYDPNSSSLYLSTDNHEKVSKAVNLYDYDGTIVYSYDKDEFLNLEYLPANPVHEGLTGQGWNWSLMDAQDYMSRHDILDIGQNYITSDGKTRIYVDLDENTLAPTLSVYCEDADTWIEVNWGDGSTASSLISEMTGYLAVNHLYDDPGEYVITIEVKNDHNIYIPGAHFSSGESWGDPNRISYLFNLLGKPSPCSNKVKKIEIGNHVTKIEGCGLARMYGLETITIPNSVIDIGDEAFGFDTSLKAVIFPKNLASHELGSYMFVGPYSLEVVSIPNGITYIGGGFLHDTWKIKRFCIPDTMDNEYNAFCLYNANSLEEVSFPVTSFPIQIGYWAFGGYTSGRLPVRIKRLNLENVDVAVIDSYMFNNSDLEEIILPENCVEIEDYAFEKCYNIQSIYMPNTVTTLGYSCFYHCYDLTDVILSTSLTNIPDYCFEECINLKTLNIPSSVETIGTQSFLGTGLEVLDIPNTVQSIGIGACQACQNLIKVKMSKNISAIPAKCFLHTPNLKLIDCLEYDTVPDLANINAFTQMLTTDYYIVVPDELYSEWIAATNWSDSSIVSHIISKTDYEMDASNVPLFDHDETQSEPIQLSI